MEGNGEWVVYERAIGDGEVKLNILSTTAVEHVRSV